MPARTDLPKVCAQCGRHFLGRKVQIYCSVRCRENRARKTEREREKKKKEKQQREAMPKISLNAIAWAAQQAHMTYGQFVQQMTKEDEARIAKQYAAYLKEEKEKEKKV